MKKNTQKKYQELVKQIRHHNHLYHTLDQPEISDFEYDKLFQELLKMEESWPELKTQWSPSFRVGGETLESFKKVKHRKPMLSLQNVFTEEDIMAFTERVKKFLKIEENQTLEYVGEPKLDGLAVEVIYEKGQLVKAITRGDGQVGEDVTHNIKTIPSLPMELKTSHPPQLLEVRGEVVILKSDFEELNKKQTEQGLPTFANPRNAAAGTIRQLSSDIAAQRPLKFYTYAFGAYEGITFLTQFDFLTSLYEFGLPTLFSHNKDLIKTLNEKDLYTYYQSISQLRSQLPFEIDGVVFKLNSVEQQSSVGSIARSPRWAAAGKFAPEQSETVIENIIIQVGRTGALTPVAQLKPIKVGGVTVSNATLHNQDEIDRKDIRIGDTVLIQRAGDVIPEVVSVNAKKRKKNSQAFKIPDHCPACQTLAQQPEGEAVKRCFNPTCPAVFKSSVQHFVSKKAMNIDKLGEKQVETFIDEGLIQSLSDIYKLKQEQILQLDRQGEKSSQNIIDSIERSKKVELHKFIFALGIRFVGEQTAYTLAQYYQNMTALLKATEEELLDLDDIGPKVTQSLLDSLSNQSFLNEVKKLLKINFQFTAPPKKQPKESLPGTGVTVVITGSFSQPRGDIKKQLQVLGFKVSSSISKKTNALLCGEKPGSKADKAKELNVEIFNLSEFNNKFNLKIKED